MQRRNRRGYSGGRSRVYLKWVAEIFFPWGGKPCHQIFLYYMVEIVNPEIPREGLFPAKERLEGRNIDLEFHWVPLKPEVYPSNTQELLEKLSESVQHFIYRE